MEEESFEQQFAEVEGHLVKLEDMDIPSIEAKVHDLRTEIDKTYELLITLEQRVLRKVNG